jgi:transcriptional regulator with XRE-family HTH domain
MMNLANRLRAARESSGLTQSDVSQASGIAVPNLSSIESGRVDFRMSTLDRVLEALGLDIQLVPRTNRVSLEGVMAWSEQGRARLVAAGVAPSDPQRRLDAQQARGAEVSVEQTLLNPSA